MRTEPRSVVVVVFEDPERARDAVNELKDAGFRGEDISVVMPDRGGTRTTGSAVGSEPTAGDSGTEARARDGGNEAGEGAATGAVVGGLIGGLGGFLVGVSALGVPVIGPVIAAGAFATALAGLAAGAAVGAIAGALIGMGIPKDEAEWYENEVRRGRTLVTVKGDGRADEAESILRRHGAYDARSREGVERA
jgi:hypothetical protein